MKKVSLRADIRLLRLAIERGLLSWEDLEAVPQPTDPGRAGPGVAWGPWVSRLIEAGHLDENALVRLIRQLDPEAEEPLPTPDEPRAPAPDNWDRYHIFSRLGAGGMGSVFKAFDPRLNRFVALKFLQARDRQHATTYLDEARAQAQVEHPLICQVYEVGEVEGQPYIAMRFIDGRPLVEAAAGFPLPTKVRLVQQVADALQAAHQKGLIHRDVKPGNILLTTNQKGELRCIVVDFGLAQTLDTRMGEGAEVAGTPDYLSPEQLAGGPIDHRTDVYSLGAVLYELLTGRVPFSGRDIGATLRRIAAGNPPPPSAHDRTIPRDLDAILRKSLARDPAERYASAADLSRDLGRFLAGEPIEAHSAALGYRASKFVRRHRWVALATAIGLATLIAVGSLALHSRRQAEQRTRLAARFGEQVNDMEAEMRFASLLPAHDISRQRRELDEQMRSLALEMERLGPIAEGPGNYALARANLARGRNELAKAQLERAWDSGYQRPEVAVALGEAIGQLYEEATYASPLPRSAVIAQATLEELGRVLRDPALLYLRAGSRDSSTLYLQALIAFYEGRYEDAIGAADAAYASRPWFYEARLLVAKAHAAEGQEATHAGRYQEALSSFDRAEAVLAELSDVARSSPAIQIAACRELNQRNETRRALGGLERAAIDQALAACDRALALDPEAADAYSLKARISWRWADEIARHGEDPRPELERAIGYASAAIERNPQSSSAYQNLAAAYRLIGGWQALRGIDPVPALEQAAAAAEAAIERQPDAAIGYNSLGNAHIMLARQEIARGADPGERISQAIAAYDKAIALNPLYTPALLNLGDAWTTRADWETESGSDPTKSVEQALVSLRRAIEINPNYLQLHNNLGNAYNTLAIARLRRNENPTTEIDAAVESYRRALEINPDYAIGLYNLAFVERLLARYQVQNGLDSSAAESAAEAAIGRAIELNPSDPENFTERAELELLRADRALRREADPTPFIAAADRALGAARALNSDAAQLLHLDALGRRYQAQWNLARGAPADELVSRGLELVDRALAANPKLSDSVALEAVLLKLQARLLPPAERPAVARRALARLDEAAAGNPALAFEYRDDRAELERLIAGS